MKEINSWILTDDDSCQYVRKNSNTEYSLIEMGLISREPDLYEVYTDTIDIQDYFDSMESELINIIDGFGYKSIEHVQRHYGDEANQVMCECIFEHYGSFQANERFRGTENECIQFIEKFVQSVG